MGSPRPSRNVLRPSVMSMAAPLARRPAASTRRRDSAPPLRPSCFEARRAGRWSVASPTVACPSVPGLSATAPSLTTRLVPESPITTRTAAPRAGTGSTRPLVCLAGLTGRVAEERSALQPQAGGLGVDARGDAVGHGWVAPQKATQCRAGECTAPKQQRGGEQALVVEEQVEADGEMPTGGGIAELVVETHGEKGRHMELLGEAVPPWWAHHVGVPVVPGRVLHLGQQGADRSRVTGAVRG